MTTFYVFQLVLAILLKDRFANNHAQCLLKFVTSLCGLPQLFL